MDLLVSREINDDFMVLIKVVEQDPDLGVKIFHPSIDDDSEAMGSDKEENNYENAPKTPYHGEILILLMMMREIIMRMPPRFHMMM